MTRLYVIRHGMRIDHEDPSWKEKATRTFDPPLSPTGRAQAAAAAAYLSQFPMAGIFCSPLLRTVQTAQPMAELCDLPLRIEGGLSEWLNPKWHDFSPGFLAPAALQEACSRLDPAYRPLVSPRYPENDEAICQARVSFVARQLADEYEGDLILVTHGVCVKHLVTTLTGGRDQANQQTCAVNILESAPDNSWRLVEIATDHLAEARGEQAAAYI